MSLGFTVKSNLASSIRNYLKAQGKNVSESDMNKILQRMADVNSARSKEESIFNGGHRYLGGSGKDFIVQNGQQVKLSAEEYNKIFEGYLDKADTEPQVKKAPAKVDLSELKPVHSETPKLNLGEVRLSDEAVKSLKNEQFKNSLSQMSDKQLRQIANSDNLTQDLDQLNMLATEIGVRGDQKTARKVAKFMKEIESKQAAEQAQATQSQQNPVETNHNPVRYNSSVQSGQELPIVKNESETTVQPVKQEPLSDEKLNDYLNNDSNYQSFLQKFNRIDTRMKEIESKYNMQRDDFTENRLFDKSQSLKFKNFSAELSQMNIYGKPEQNEYSDLCLSYRSLKSGIESYKTKMQNWQDGHVSDVSRRGYNTFTNVERITLNNGQHVYKSDQGVFYPDVDGGIGLNPVPKELLD